MSHHHGEDKVAANIIVTTAIIAAMNAPPMVLRVVHPQLRSRSLFLPLQLNTASSLMKTNRSSSMKSRRQSTSQS